MRGLRGMGWVSVVFLSVITIIVLLMLLRMFSNELSLFLW